MLDMTKTIEPKSDQMNADDLLSGPKTIKITAVKISDDEQSVSICYDGGAGKPYKPCKSMRRVFVKAWGKDGEKYIGRLVTVFCDPDVKWAGSEVGGIRISHMSDVDAPFTMMLTQTRGRRAPHTVKPIKTAALNPLSDDEFNALNKEIEAAENMSELATVGEKIKAGNFDKSGAKRLRDVYSKAVAEIRGDG